MIPKYNIGDNVSSNGIKGSVSAIELDSMITANVQPYYVVSMEYKELLPESSLQHINQTIFFFVILKIWTDKNRLT